MRSQYSCPLPVTHYELSKKNSLTCKKASELCEKYQKIKTELCRNWVNYNFCQYGSKCQYAHGTHELKNKRVILDNFKQKPCKNFFNNAFCPYGYKCQYLHRDIIYKEEMRNVLFNIYHKKKISTKLIKNQTIYHKKINNQAKLEQSMSKNQKRLPFFKQISSGSDNQ